jgi:hypothetical protein
VHGFIHGDVLVELIGILHGTVFYAGVATGALVHVDVFGFFGYGYSEIAWFSYYFIYLGGG